MGNKTISIGRDFSRYPAGRYLDDGPNNGEKFRNNCLLPALKEKNEKIFIELDSARGYGSSFLEEAFGGLIRKNGFTVNDLLNKFEFRSQDNSLIEEIKGYIQEAGMEVQEIEK